MEAQREAAIEKVLPQPLMDQSLLHSAVRQVALAARKVTQKLQKQQQALQKYMLAAC